MNLAETVLIKILCKEILQVKNIELICYVYRLLAIIINVKHNTLI